MNQLIQRITTRSHGAAPLRPLAAFFALPLTSRLAIGLSLLWMIVATFNLDRGAILSVQHDPLYRAISGSILLTYIGYQWLLPFHRVFHHTAQAKAYFKRHTWAGALSPLLFFAHSTRLGFGFLAFLSICFVVNTVIGALHPKAVGVQSAAYRPWWLVIHIAVSLCLTALAVFHVYVVVRYR